MDSVLIPEGADRCGLGKFSAWVAFCLALILWGLVSAGFCLLFGLNQTNMNDYFAFGLWIVFDLAVIGLGAGAFSTGLLTHIIRMHDLKAIVNAAVIIGFLCYSGAVLMLGIDIGQPIRGWFIFWHANVHSMLTEVSFCITTYLIVLIIEYLPRCAVQSDYKHSIFFFIIQPLILFHRAENHPHSYITEVYGKIQPKN